MLFKNGQVKKKQYRWSINLDINKKFILKNTYKKHQFFLEKKTSLIKERCQALFGLASWVNIGPYFIFIFKKS
jgi:hypothetical protein